MTFKSASSLTLLGILLIAVIPMRAQVNNQLFGPHSLLRFQRNLAMQQSAAGAKSGAETMAARGASTTSLMLKTPKLYSFASVDYPGAAFSQVTGSNGKTEVGFFEVDPSASDQQSFSRTGNQYQIITVPDSQGTSAYGINTPGVIVGGYTDLAGNLHGFIDNTGAFTTLDPPGSTATVVAAINDSGDLTGVFVDAAGQHGFIDQAGVFTTIDYPGGSSTQPTGINLTGELTGTFIDASNKSHGFIWNNGLFTQIDFPGGTDTTPFGINDAGEVAGFYTDAASVMHGFLYQNAFNVVDLPGAASTLLTRVDNKGRLAGIYSDVLKEYHGMIAQ